MRYLVLYSPVGVSGTTSREAAMDRYMVELEWKTSDLRAQQPIREKYGIMPGMTINWRSFVEADDTKLSNMRDEQSFRIVRKTRM